jgi:hypothetical protein
MPAQPDYDIDAPSAVTRLVPCTILPMTLVRCRLHGRQAGLDCGVRGPHIVPLLQPVVLTLTDDHAGVTLRSTKRMVFIHDSRKSERVGLPQLEVLGTSSIGTGSRPVRLCCHGHVERNMRTGKSVVGTNKLGALSIAQLGRRHPKRAMRTKRIKWRAEQHVSLRGTSNLWSQTGVIGRAVARGFPAHRRSPTCRSSNCTR